MIFFIELLHKQNKMPQQIPLEKTLGKRKYAESFDPSTFDDDRYAQHISPDFFDTHIGHGVFPISKNTQTNKPINQ